MLKAIGFIGGMIVGLAYVAFSIWRMFILGAFIAFFRIAFSDK